MAKSSSFPGIRKSGTSESASRSVASAHPRLDPLVHEPVQQLVAGGLVLESAPRPLGDERVVADVGDVALELRELVVAACRAAHAEELGLIAAAATGSIGTIALPVRSPATERGVGLVDVQLDAFRNFRHAVSAA